jgi:hypothetical protein
VFCRVPVAHSLVSCQETKEWATGTLQNNTQETKDWATGTLQNTTQETEEWATGTLQNTMHRKLKNGQQEPFRVPVAHSLVYCA